MKLNNTFISPAGLKKRRSRGFPPPFVSFTPATAHSMNKMAKRRRNHLGGVKRKRLRGGSFFGKIGHFFKHDIGHFFKHDVLPGLKKAGEFAEKKVLPVVEKVAPYALEAASMVGAGKKSRKILRFL